MKTGGIIGIVIGAMVATVGLIILATFITNTNTSVLDRTSSLIVTNIPVFVALGILVFIAARIFGGGGKSGGI
jgi:uncharacterized membrane protein YidH (DUF202 family)